MTEQHDLYSHIVKISEDIGKIKSTVDTIEKNQLSSIGAVSETVKKNSDRIQSLEDTRKKAIFTVGGVSLTGAFIVAFPKASAFFHGLFTQ